MDVDVGGKIKALRKENGLTQDELCNSLNIKYNTSINKGMISKWENNKEQPRLEFIINIADYFNTDVSFLLGLSERRYKLSFDIIGEIINKYIPDIIILLKSSLSTEYISNSNIKLSEESYTKLSVEIASELSRIDFYDAYDPSDSEIHEKIEKYVSIPSAKETFDIIRKNVNDINLYSEIQVVIEEAYGNDDFYGLDLRKIILKYVNDIQLTEKIVHAIYYSKTMKNITFEITRSLENMYFEMFLSDILQEHIARLNTIGKEKVLDYIKDLLSNDKYKEGD